MSIVLPEFECRLAQWLKRAEGHLVEQTDAKFTCANMRAGFLMGVALRSNVCPYPNQCTAVEMSTTANILVPSRPGPPNRGPAWDSNSSVWRTDLDPAPSEEASVERVASRPHQ